MFQADGQAKSRITLQQMQEEYGQRASSSKMERVLYSRDLAPVPSLLVDPLFHTLPDLIIRPINTEEVSAIMQRASAEGIPVTPRAGATTVFFNSVPVKGGIVMDLNQLRGIIALDETDRTVTVRAATTWSELESYLNARGFACKSMPSSAPAATVGGWFCMMGYGIGSLKYGDLLSQVRAMEVVLPDGKAVSVSPVSDPPLKWFAESEGTLGIITEVKLEIRRLSAMKHFLLCVPDMRRAVLLMHDLMGGKIGPYNMHFSDRHYVKMMGDLGFSHTDSGSGCQVAVDFEESEEEAADAEAQIGHLLETHGSAILLPEATAELEWEERFKSLRLKRGGPSILGGEILLPVDRLMDYLEDIKKTAARYGVLLMSYGHVVSPDRATVMTAFFADERRALEYIFSLALVKKIQDAGYRHGGCPYGVGLWNTPYIRRIYSSSDLKALRKRKSRIDPKGIMNPGKVYRAPFLLNPFFFGAGMAVFALMRRAFRNGR